MKHKLKKNIMLAVTVLMIFICTNVTASAAFQVEVISNLSTDLVADIPNKTFDDDPGVTYQTMGGFAIGKGKNSMFVLKAAKNEQMAAFYYFPEIDEPDRYGVYRLRYAGHANAMAIDNKNIYVCGWVSDSDNKLVGYQENNKNNNWIIKIPRKIIAGMGLTKTGELILKDLKSTEEVEGFSILYPKVKSVASDGTVTYSDYEGAIAAITKYKSDGNFLVRYKQSGISGHFVYTKAKLETYNGKEYFVVSEDPDDVFVIKNTIQNKSAVGQDIFYSDENGLFLPRWYGGGEKTDEYYNPAKNVIVWANIDSNIYTNITSSNGHTYKMYTPAKINVNMGTSNYDRFEIESLAFNQDNDMLFSANVRKAGATADTDAVYKLLRNDGSQFTIS